MRDHGSDRENLMASGARSKARGRSSAFALVVPLLATFLLISSSGCLSPCRTHVRTVTWSQDDAPVPESHGGRSFMLDELWGSAWREPNGTGEIYLNVHSN